MGMFDDLMPNTQSAGPPSGMFDDLLPPAAAGGDNKNRQTPSGMNATPNALPLSDMWESAKRGFKAGVSAPGQSVLDSLVAGGQGTNPDVANSGYMKAPQTAQAIFNETGQVQDQRNMVALRDPESGKYQVYFRSPDADEGRLTSFARSFTSGMMTGGPPGVSAAISGAVSPVLNAGKNVGNIVGIGSGETKALGKIASTLRDSVAGGGPDALDMTGRLVGGTGKQPMTLADVGGPELQGLLGQAMRVPGPGRTAGMTFLQNRDLGAGARLSADVNEGLGGERTAFQTAQDLSQAQKTAAGPAYEKAFAGDAYSPRIQEFIDEPKVKSGINQGIQLERLDALAENRPFDPLSYGVALDKDGNWVTQGTPNMRTLDAGKRGLDAMIAAERNDLTGKLSPLGRSLNNVRVSYLGELDRLNPDYAAARAAFSGPAQSMDAMKMGENIFNMKPEEIAQAVSQTDEGNRQFLRLGVESALRKTIAQTGPAGDEARALLKNNYVQQQLRPIFGSKADFDKVISAAKNESMMAQTKYNLVGNSMTQGRAVQDASGEGGSLMRPLAEAGAAFGAHEPILGAKAVLSFGQALKARAQGMTPAVAEQIVRSLLDPSMSHDIGRAHAALAGPRRVLLPPFGLQPNPAAISGLLAPPQPYQR